MPSVPIPKKRVKRLLRRVFVSSSKRLIEEMGKDGFIFCHAIKTGQVFKSYFRIPKEIFGRAKCFVIFGVEKGRGRKS